MLKEALKKIEQAIIKEFNISASALASSVKKLSDGFTKKREELPNNYLSNLERRRAYIAGFLLPNAAKVLHCLNEAFKLGCLSKKDGVSILDLGCGPATASLATSLFFDRAKELSFAAVEQSKDILNDGKKIFESLDMHGRRFEAIPCVIAPSKIGRTLGNRRFEIITIGNLLNELEDEELSFKLIHELITNHLTDDGVLIIIDPALKKTTRPLMGMRNRLLNENGNVDVIAPCLHGQNCPMLIENDRNWCHFYLEWQRPEIIKQLDDLTGLDRRYLKMAYFIFHRSANDSRFTTHNSQHYRVVSSPLISKGKRELMLCGSNGELKRTMRVDREASERNSNFANAMRGDIVETDATKRIRTENSFRIINKYNN